MVRSTLDFEALDTHRIRAVVATDAAGAGAIVAYPSYCAPVRLLELTEPGKPGSVLVSAQEVLIQLRAIASPAVEARHPSIPDLEIGVDAIHSKAGFGIAYDFSPNGQVQKPDSSADSLQYSGVVAESKLITELASSQLALSEWMETEPHDRQWVNWASVGLAVRVK